MFTIDASVHINAVNPAEEGSAESQAFLKQLRDQAWPMFSPTLLLVEVATAVARAQNDSEHGIAIAQAIRGIPNQVWIPLDGALAEDATRLGAEHRLRGADAIYAAVALRYRTTLITLDRQQLERLSPTMTVLTPAQAIERLAVPPKAEGRRA